MGRRYTTAQLSAQIKELQDRLRDLREQLNQTISERDTVEQKLAVATRANAFLQQRHNEHAAVLQGDRDVLTRALEVCTRRLASPIADKDPVRAGWRAANVLQTSALNEKAESPEPRR